MSYKGFTFPIQVGIDGWSGNKNQSQIKSTQLITAQDVTYEFGTLGKEGGAVKYNTNAIAGTPVVLGGSDWWPDPATQRIVIACNDGKMYKDSGAGTFPITLKSGLTSTPRFIPFFVSGGAESLAQPRKLFMFNGVDNVQVLSADGATTHDLALPPSDWTTKKPVTADIYNLRLWVGAGHYVYFSNTSDHEDFTTVNVTGQLAVYPGVGEEIVAVKAFKGMLVVWKKPFGIFFVNAQDPQIANWSVSQVTPSIGAAGPGAVCPVDNDVLFMDITGSINQISAVLQFGTFASSSISFAADIDPFIRDTINLPMLGSVQSGYHAHKREVHFAVPQIGSSRNNGRLVVDYNRPDIARFRWSIRDVCPGLWMAKDSSLTPNPMIGDASGFVWMLDQPTRSQDGNGYLSLWQSGHEDFNSMFVGYPSLQKLATQKKNFQFMEIVSEPKGNWNITIEWYTDSVLRGSLPFNMGVSGAALGSFVLGTDALAGAAVQSKRRRIWGAGKRISVAGFTSGAGQDFSIDKVFISFMPGAE